MRDLSAGDKHIALLRESPQESFAPAREMPNDEYRALLTQQALDCLDEDLRAPHDGRVWAKTFFEESLQIQQIRLMRDLIQELRKGA